MGPAQQRCLWQWLRGIPSLKKQKPAAYKIDSHLSLHNLPLLLVVSCDCLWTLLRSYSVASVLACSDPSLCCNLIFEQPLMSFFNLIDYLTILRPVKCFSGVMSPMKSLHCLIEQNTLGFFIYIQLLYMSVHSHQLCCYLYCGCSPNSLHTYCVAGWFSSFSADLALNFAIQTC